MKSLLLLRHGKASRLAPMNSDHERPLADRGQRNASQLGAFIAGRGPAPELVLCSSAQRTRETLELVCGELGDDPEIRIESQLYLAPEGEILARIQEVEDEVCSVLVIGHNPGLGDLALRLGGTGDREAHARMARKFPTSALAAYHFDVESWKQVNDSRGEILYYTTPSDLES